MGDGATARQRMRAALEARDHAAFESLLAPNVVLHSPIIGSAFEGRAAVSDLYAVVIDRIRDYRYTREFEANGEQFLMVEGTLRGVRFEDMIILRVDDEGLIEDITLIIRPLAGVIAFLVTLGGPLARRKSRLHGIAMRLAGAPLPLVGKLVEWLAPKMVALRR